MLNAPKIHTVLLVEDSEDDAFIFNWRFQQSGCECVVEHVSDGAAAIEFLRNASASGSLPCLMFLDLKMPVLNGFEVLSWLREQDFSSAIRTIVLSGSDQQSDRERALHLGASDYLVKPVKANDIRDLLVNICPPVGGASEKRH
ncbi:MAG TPA: response regulator [Verrucomicrobiae bacterium]|nr:response regulator [Verrucomicrobiae bacterium]